MRLNNYSKWLQLCSSRPHAMTIFLRRVFEPRESTCTCRKDGTMFILGNINECTVCTDNICTLDTHYFLGSTATAIIGWLSVLIEGKNL